MQETIEQVRLKAGIVRHGTHQLAYPYGEVDELVELADKCADEAELLYLTQKAITKQIKIGLRGSEKTALASLKSIGRLLNVLADKGETNANIQTG